MFPKKNKDYCSCHGIVYVMECVVPQCMRLYTYRASSCGLTIAAPQALELIREKKAIILCYIEL